MKIKIPVTLSAGGMASEIVAEYIGKHKHSWTIHANYVTRRNGQAYVVASRNGGGIATAQNIRDEIVFYMPGEWNTPQTAKHYIRSYLEHGKKLLNDLTVDMRKEFTAIPMGTTIHDMLESGEIYLLDANHIAWNDKVVSTS